jgi:hypothetical protein
MEAHAAIFRLMLLEISRSADVVYWAGDWVARGAGRATRPSRHP